SASIFPVQPWLDVPELGCASVLVADGDVEGAQRIADELVDMLWERRRAFRVPLVPPEDAVRRARAAVTGPILLVDSADGTSSGAPGDSTAILRALLADDLRSEALVSLVDPDAARFAAAHDGEEMSLAVGGRLDPDRHQPVQVTGRARRVENAV